MCENNNNSCSCYTNILNTIVTLQKQGDICDDALLHHVFTTQGQ